MAGDRNIEGIVEILDVETNILIFSFDSASESDDFLKRLEENGIYAAPFGPKSIRFVTHLDIGNDHMEMLEKVLKKLS